MRALAAALRFPVGSLHSILGSFFAQHSPGVINSNLPSFRAEREILRCLAWYFRRYPAESGIERRPEHAAPPAAHMTSAVRGVIAIRAELPHRVVGGVTGLRSELGNRVRRWGGSVLGLKPQCA